MHTEVDTEFRWLMEVTELSTVLLRGWIYKHGLGTHEKMLQITQDVISTCHNQQPRFTMLLFYFQFLHCCSVFMRAGNF